MFACASSDIILGEGSVSFCSEMVLEICALIGWLSCSGGWDGVGWSGCTSGLSGRGWKLTRIDENTKSIHKSSNSNFTHCKLARYNHAIALFKNTTTDPVQGFL